MPPSEGSEIEVDIIAVNGLGANPDWTWKSQVVSEVGAKKKYISWLHELLPEDAKTARIIPFRQNSSYLINAPVKSIEDCAYQLLNDVERVRRGKGEQKRPIIFIGHSFGGLVIKQAIVLAAGNSSNPLYSAIFQSTWGILFLGTPHNGTWASVLVQFITSFTWFVGGNSEILDDLGLQSPKLEALDDNFRKIFHGRTVCFYETDRTRIYNLLPIMVVDRHSATMKANNNKNVELKTDHSHLNKFATKDSNYNLVVWEIVDLISTSVRRYDVDIKDCLESLQADIESHASLRTDIQKSVTGTCDWVVREVEGLLQNLPNKEATSGALIFLGGPGTGKSTLSKFIAEHLEEVKVDVKYIIFKEGSPATSQPTPAIRLLVHQLLSKNHTLYRHIRKRHEERSEWTLEILLDVFEKMMADETSESTIIVIDALNECDNEPRTHGAKKDFKPLTDFMNKLRHLEHDVTRHFIITTQRIDELSTGFRKRRIIDLDDREEVKSAVKVYIKDQVHGFLDDYLKELKETEMSEGGESSGDEQGARRGGDTRYESLRKEYEDLRPYLLAELTKKADRMFLWVYLFIDRLRHLQSTSPGDILKELEGLPKGLISIYIEIFSRRQKEQPEAISQKLPWILFAQQPLTREELRDALAVQFYRKNPTIPFEKWRPGNLEKDLSLNFGPLVTIEKSSSRVRLFHSSLRGALLGQGEPPCEELMKICQTPKEEHAEIAATCLDYLSLPQFGLREFKTVNLSDPDPANSTIPLLKKFPFLKESGLLDNFPFLKYAATSWAYHAREAGEDHPKVEKALEKFLGLKENLELAFQIFIRSLPHVHGKNIDLPHKLSEWGLEKLAIARIKAGDNFDQKNEFGNHLLHSTAWNGLLDLMKFLEENGVKADMEDGVGQTALHHAAQTGHVETVEYLISKNLPLDSSGRRKWTPLHYAASGHHLDVIITLLDAGADARKTDFHLQTPQECLRRVLDRDPVSKASLGAQLETVVDKLSLSERDGPKRKGSNEGSSSGHAVDEQTLDLPTDPFC